MDNFILRSRRNNPPSGVLIEHVSEPARTRIYIALCDCLKRDGYGQEYRLEKLVRKAVEALFKETGKLEGYPTNRSQNQNQADYSYLLTCSNDSYLDLLELLFYLGVDSLPDDAVTAVNVIFQEESIVYELTPTKVKKSKIEDGDREQNSFVFGKPVSKAEYEYSVIICKSEDYLHSEVVKPCLNALADSRFEAALGEMMNAHNYFRLGEYPVAILYANSSFESVMKTICTAKNWTFNSDSSCSHLVKVCKDNGLLFSFYISMFEAVGRLRNKMGDAHGQGPEPSQLPSKEHAAHMIQIASAHITLLVKLAAL